MADARPPAASGAASASSGAASASSSAAPVPSGSERDGRTAARYVAIITDGNGRWARARGLPVNAGHEAGADTVKARLRDAVELGVRELTVYSFSTENWSRSPEEVQGLFEMFSRRIAGETPELHAEGVRMRFIGRRAGLPAELVEQMRWAEELTDANSTISMFVAFNYGGRAEIVDAALCFAAERDARLTGAGSTPTAEAPATGSGGGSGEAQPNEEDFRRCLYAPEMHDPDLIIRTSGERRLSNYLLWQSAYSELVFRDELWPDFTRAAFEQSLAEFSARRRRFGGR
jgi:undecaprenyl diphosphate synthase